MSTNGDRHVWRVLGGIALTIVALGGTAWAGWVSLAAIAVPVVSERVDDLRETVHRIEDKLDRLLERGP